jgi:hypothetical protein
MVILHPKRSSKHTKQYWSLLLDKESATVKHMAVTVVLSLLLLVYLAYIWIR